MKRLTCVLELLMHLHGKNVKCSHKRLDYSNFYLSKLSNGFNSNCVITEDSCNFGPRKVIEVCLVQMAVNDSKFHVKES